MGLGVFGEPFLMTGSQIPKLNMKARLLCLLQTCVFCIQVPEASAGVSALSESVTGSMGIEGKTTDWPAHMSPPPHTDGARQRAHGAVVGKK